MPKTAIPKPKSKPTPATESVPVPLPPSVMGLLNRKQVCEALGRLSERSFRDLIGEGKFPRADKRIGRRPRWSVAIVNQWVHDLDATED